MLLEKKLVGYLENGNRDHFETNNMGLLDTSRSASANSRLITAMLADRPYQADRRPTSTVYTSYPTSPFSGTISGTYNMDRQSVSDQYKSALYMTNAPRSDSDERSPKGAALPTCVVNPSSTDTGYRSFDEDSYPPGYIPSRKQREFIPENKKDDGYWEKRRKNNEAARRSREKRRVHDMALENRIMDLTRENCKIRNELILVKKKFGLSLDETYTGDETESKGREGPPTLHAVSETMRPSNPTMRVVSPENQARYPVTLQQSPVRNRNISGTSPSQYMHTFPSYSTSSRQPSSQIITESYYINHANADPESKYSGNFDAQSPYNPKSMKNDHNPSQVRVDDQVRPSYSSALPPNQISPYNSSLPVPYQKSYWLPTTDLTSSDSNDECDWNDQDVQEQPLSLVKKRPSTENESSGELSNTSSGASNSPTSASASLPLKLRHKVSNESQLALARQEESSLLSYQNGLAQLSEVALAHSNMSVSPENYNIHNINDSFDSRPRSFSNPRSIYDNKYVERRRKNNEAARKCRENRKQLTKIREVKSGYLASENGKLKSELKGLQEEMRELRGLLEKKRQDKGDIGDLGNNPDVEECNETDKIENENSFPNTKIKEENDIMDED